MASLNRDQPAPQDGDRPTSGYLHPRASRLLRWRKAFRDLAFDRLRTLLVILSLGIGVTVFGMIIITTIVIPRVALGSYLDSKPASAGLFVPAGFEQDLVDAIKTVPGVQGVVGRRQATIRIQNSNGEWVDLNLVHMSSLEEGEVQVIDIIAPSSGEWPPTSRTLILERNSRLYTGLDLDDRVIAEAPNGRLLSFPISGLAYDASRPPSQVAGVATAFVDRETFEWLGLDTSYNELRFTVASNPLDVDHIARIGDEVQRKVERSGRLVSEVSIRTPGEHPLGFLLDTVILILRIVAVMALLLSTFLIINTLTAMLTQHSRQIAVMKAIGGTTRMIVTVYLRMVLLLSLGGLLFSMPLAILLGNLFARFIAFQLNVTIAGLMIPQVGLLLIVVAGLLVPLVATLSPIRSKAAITIRDALDDRGGDVGSGGAQLGRLGQALRWVKQGIEIEAIFSRPVRLSLRNTFRRKGRLALTLFTLILGGAIFVGVMTLRTALFETLEETIVNQGFDVSVQTDQPVRIDRLEQVVHQTTGVAQSEGWLVNPAVIIMPDGRDGARIELRALPADTAFFTPKMASGRWLPPGDQQGVVLHQSIDNELPGLAVGDQITLKVFDDEIEWEIIGITEDLLSPLTPVIAYVSYDSFAYRFDQVGKTNTLRVQTERHDTAFIASVAASLEVMLPAAGLEPRSITTIQLIRDILTERFNLVTVVLTLLSTMIAAVGGLGLMGTMSINVMERRREIGVMRSIGGTDRALLRIFMIEGGIIGLLSWLGASILGQPLSRGLGYQIGNTMLQTPLQPVIAWWAIGLWLILVFVISMLSSYVPAKQATEVSIQKTLAYE